MGHAGRGTLGLFEVWGRAAKEADGDLFEGCVPLLLLGITYCEIRGRSEASASSLSTNFAHVNE